LVTRREALRLTAAGIAGGVLSGFASACHPAPQADVPSVTRSPARLQARVPSKSAPPNGEPPRPGITSLGLASGKDGLRYIPTSYRATSPAPLVLMLHGAGRSSDEGIHPFVELADEAGLILVAPDSRGRTWDFLYGPYGDDVAFIDRALDDTFRRYTVDPARITIEGFSDGASYALSLGLTNGDLFSRIVAFSPCILAPAAFAGRPRVFISHGTNDRILPIDQCGRRIAAQLKDNGYEVDYREFTGPHTVPPALARGAVDWLRADAG
jgi:phospholipase/carboxylesterase